MPRTKLYSSGSMYSLKDCEQINKYFKKIKTLFFKVIWIKQYLIKLHRKKKNVVKETKTIKLFFERVELKFISKMLKLY